MPPPAEATQASLRARRILPSDYSRPYSELSSPPTPPESSLGHSAIQPRAPSPGAETPIAKPLGPPVPDDEIASLPDLTVSDVFRGLYIALYERFDIGPFYRKWDDHEQRLMHDVSSRRFRRPQDKRTSNKIRDRNYCLVDRLIDDVMFDGFIPVKTDGRGGLELELVLREPSENELQWLDDHQ
jgi:hypothetical protein